MSHRSSAKLPLSKKHRSLQNLQAEQRSTRIPQVTLISKSRWGLAGETTKKPNEIRRIFETYAVGNFRNRQRGMEQQSLRLQQERF